MARKVAPMDFFAWRLSQVLDLPVIDQTRLAGGYDFDLEFVREPPMGGPVPPGFVSAPPADSSGPTVFQALRRVGLKLERRRAPVQIMVIDHAEKPVEN